MLLSSSFCLIDIERIGNSVLEDAFVCISLGS